MSKIILSLGAGVQSSCMALMCEYGELPKPDLAIFSDTGAEPKAVMDWLDYLKTKLSFPVVTVMQNKGLTKQIESAIEEGSGFVSVPLFTESKNGGGMLRRQCTREFKIAPITRYTREWLGFKKGQRIPKGEILVRRMIGISLDEIQRMKTSFEHWGENYYPLVEKRMTRWDCLRWMKENGYPEPPRSACVYCPYKSDSEWRRLKSEDDEGWNEAIRMDEMVRNATSITNEKTYLHRSMKPLESVDFTTDIENGKIPLWNAECEGMCGL